MRAALARTRSLDTAQTDRLVWFRWTLQEECDNVLHTD